MNTDADAKKNAAGLSISGAAASAAMAEAQN